VAEHDDTLVVAVVDDDASVRDSLALLLGLRGYRTLSFAAGEDLLASANRDWAGCVVADLRMPGMSGLDLAAALKARGIAIPFVIITAHGDVSAARAAFRLNAVDFLEKPFDDDDLVDAIDSAFAHERWRIATDRREHDRNLRLGALTPREREVAELVAQGMRNAAIAGRLGISARTVEVHKARLMNKLAVRELDELIHLLRDAPP
jgi:FixJ family two-component response regulator